MGELIKTFAFDRNSIKKNAEASTASVYEHLSLATSGKVLDKTQSNIIGAMRSYLGVVDVENRVTEIGEKYLKLYQENTIDAWSWLLTRALWLYSVPNGTNAKVNDVATTQSARFSLFRNILAILVQLESLPNDERFLSYEELAFLLDDDANWQLSPQKMYSKIFENRKSQEFSNDKIWLGDLEEEYQIPRDNMGTYFTKCLCQTGLFEYKKKEGKGAATAISIKPDLTSVERGRIRFIIDNLRQYSGSDWLQYIQNPSDDLPAIASKPDESNKVHITELPDEDDKPLSEMVNAFLDDCSSNGLSFEKNQAKRFIASLIAKRFVILSGLSGSGKTKLAQAFATWMTSRTLNERNILRVGDVVKSDKTQYVVTDVGAISIELDSEGSKLVSLPWGLIDEWIATITEKQVDRTATARSIRELVSDKSRYSSQLNSFETHLKAIAFHIKDNSPEAEEINRYELVPVGPDWTSRESCLGYLDGLDPTRYVRTTALIDLIVAANNFPNKPFFTILDEMNLSHVERYFADFLSASESDEEIFLHGSEIPVDGIPPKINWPKNLFVIGTVNVDETTYTFSPKVLDRANTLEFRVRQSQIGQYLEGASKEISISNLAGKGTVYSNEFISSATSVSIVQHCSPRVKAEILLLFDVLSHFGHEFGFRTAHEIIRFAGAFQILDPDEDKLLEVLDAQVLQKVLPRLHGSRRKLEGPLCALSQYCKMQRIWSETDEINNSEDIMQIVIEALRLSDTKYHPLSADFDTTGSDQLPLSFEKICRMLRRLDEEGFTSFTEA